MISETAIERLEELVREYEARGDQWARRSNPLIGQIASLSQLADYERYTDLLEKDHEYSDQVDFNLLRKLFLSSQGKARSGRELAEILRELSIFLDGDE